MLSVALTYVLMQPLTFSVSTMLANSDREDFTVTDIYNAMADSRLVRTLNSNIVVVDIGSSDRNDIASILESVALAAPAVVGLDVMFASPADSVVDSRLLEAICMCPAIVLPVKVGGDDNSGLHVDGESFFYPTLTDASYGVTTFPTRCPNGIVRRFATGFPMARGDTIPSFAMAIAELYAPEEAHICRQRGNRFESINYPSEEFMVITPAELDGMSADLADKIVLVGAIGDPDDVHQTPVDSRMSGILIHAHAISTIVNEAYYREFSRAQNMALALVACFLFAFMSVSLNPGIKGIVNRLVQVLFLYIIVVGGYDLFVSRGVVIDISYTVMMIAFCLFAADIWIGSTFIIRRLRARRSHVSPAAGPLPSLTTSK